jgi:hypothetical protein
MSEKLTDLERTRIQANGYEPTQKLLRLYDEQSYRVAELESRINTALVFGDRSQIAYETESDRVDDIVDALNGKETLK